MRNSINYNLKCFIMRISGTKPIKNTMRKQSPVKMVNAAGAAMGAAKKGLEKATEAATKKVAKKEATTTKSTPTTKPSRPTVKGKATMEKTPAMQLKKAGKSSCK